MTNNVENLLIISAKLYKHLTDIPEADERDDFIDEINDLLEQRGELLSTFQEIDQETLRNHQLMPHLLELDKGIQQRLQKVMSAVKEDLKRLQKSKKSEQQYLNPYSDVRVMDGMYYDGKK